MGLIDEQIAGFSESELGGFRDSTPWELTCESQSGKRLKLKGGDRSRERLQVSVKGQILLLAALGSA
ncbi:hypothetical protein CU048_09210 [Beijerinckiaceae bacterium]|nr:hypothetical protein CU048_09210 [Beijerinckiaceae bacterium]